MGNDVQGRDGSPSRKDFGCLLADLDLTLDSWDRTGGERCSDLYLFLSFSTSILVHLLLNHTSVLPKRNSNPGKIFVEKNV